jgi:acid phosphatase family membrane protein YuiD
VDYNPYIVIPFATWAVAQVTKFAIAAFRGKIDFRYLYASGGMPSVHSAVVCSLATTALLVDGMSSHLFGFTAIFAAVVMYDSFGVRRSTGEQAAAINMIIGSLDRNRVKLDEPDLHIREILGHQPREVTAGAILGVGLAMLFNYDRLGAFGRFLQTVPKRPELIAYLAVFVLILAGGVAARFVLRAKYSKSKAMKQLAKRILTLTQTIGWMGLLSVVLIYENASYFAWRLWPRLVFLVAALWTWWLVTVSYREVPQALATEADQARKRKWLNWGGKRRKKRA